MPEVQRPESQSQKWQKKSPASRWRTSTSSATGTARRSDGTTEGSRPSHRSQSSVSARATCPWGRPAACRLPAWPAVEFRPKPHVDFTDRSDGSARTSSTTGGSSARRGSGCPSAWQASFPWRFGPALGPRRRVRQRLLTVAVFAHAHGMAEAGAWTWSGVPTTTASIWRPISSSILRKSRYRLALGNFSSVERAAPLVHVAQGHDVLLTQLPMSHAPWPPRRSRQSKLVVGRLVLRKRRQPEGGRPYGSRGTQQLATDEYDDWIA